MTNDQANALTVRDKINILLKEYDTLRVEIITIHTDPASKLVRSLLLPFLGFLFGRMTAVAGP